MDLAFIEDNLSRAQVSSPAHAASCLPYSLMKKMLANADQILAERISLFRNLINDVLQTQPLIDIEGEIFMMKRRPERFLDLPGKPGGGCFQEIIKRLNNLESGGHDVSALRKQLAEAIPKIVEFNLSVIGYVFVEIRDLHPCITQTCQVYDSKSGKYVVIPEKVLEILESRKQDLQLLKTTLGNFASDYSSEFQQLENQFAEAETKLQSQTKEA